MKNYSYYGPMLLRYGIALVFLWFGISQVIDPAYFVGYLPQFLFDLSYAQTLVIINGVFEIVFALFLICGYFVRIVAALLALHLAFITFEVGYGETMVRDFGLTVMTIVVALNGADAWCLGKKKQ